MNGNGNNHTKVKLSEISKICSKCPILIKEVAVVKDLQFKLMDKFEELEKKFDTIMSFIVEKVS
jgi:hypothetical protein